MRDEPYLGMGKASKAEGLYLQKEEKEENHKMPIFSRETPSAHIPVELIKDKSVLIPTRFLYIFYRTFTDNKFRFAFVGQKRIAKELERSPRTISKQLAELGKAGWLTKIKRGQGHVDIIILHQYKSEIITEKEKKAYKLETEKRIKESFRYGH